MGWDQISVQVSRSLGSTSSKTFANLGLYSNMDLVDLATYLDLATKFLDDSLLGERNEIWS